MFKRAAAGGVHAAALTPAGKLVLVKLRYAPGWRLPGGGRGRAESAQEAVLRELREEIGMSRHGAVDRAGALFVVRDVEYRPRWSIEVEAVRAFDPDRLPPDLAPIAKRWIAALRPFL